MAKINENATNLRFLKKKARKTAVFRASIIC
jgi:hypothetical protein